MKWWLTLLLKGLGLLFIINGLFFEQSFISMYWVNALYMELTYNAEVLFSQQWYHLTPLFRSLLFLVLIWLISYLLHYWFVVMKRIFLFIFLTFVYITVLDSFTVYEADLAIVRTFIISLIALGIANFMREMDKELIQFKWIKKTPVWLFPLIAIVFFASIVGFAAPKFDPKWPDPVPFIQSATGNNGNAGEGSGVQKVGYGEDDSRLGGSFVQDNTPVFQAAVSAEHYWRIETKDVYTGKGWELSADSHYNRQANGSIKLETFTDNVETERLESILYFQGNTDIKKLIYPYGIKQVYAAEASYYLDDISEAIDTIVNDKVTALDNYSIAYDNPSFAVDEMKKVKTKGKTSIEKYYTQLPSSLPNRVGDLAEEITSTYDNRYDKAKAIERHFSKSGTGFIYQTEDVPVPGRNEDYVDQFLFDSKVGYCDNFSTSMVVMLRTLDIPARWAKGFTSGQKIADNMEGSEGDLDIYEVTNSNAHSWVEVYFPEIGWVPFEPTQGFSNLSDFHTDTGNDTAVGEQDDILESTPEQEEAEEEQEPEKETKTDADSTAADQDAASFSLKWWHIGIGVVILIILLVVVYKTRLRWQTLLLARKLAHKQDAKTFQEAYHHLMKVLKHYGFPKETDQTIREYAKRIDDHYHTDEMGQLTTHFEHVLYRNKIKHSQVRELTQLWKDLIKRIMG